MDSRHIRQADQLAAVAAVNNRVYLHLQAAQPQLHNLPIDRRPPGIQHQILLVQEAHHPVKIEVERGQFLQRYLDKNLLLLLAEQGDLADAFYQFKLTLYAVHVLLQLAGLITVAGHHQGDAVYVPIVVVDVRNRRTLGQQRFRVGHLTPQFVPDLVDFLRLHFLVHLHQDLRQAGSGGRTDGVDFGQLANGIFQRVGQLELDLFGGGTGIGGDDQCVLGEKRRVFQPAQVEERHYASHGQQNKHHPADGAMAYRILGDIHGELLPLLIWLDINCLAGTEPRQAGVGNNVARLEFATYQSAVAGDANDLHRYRVHNAIFITPYAKGVLARARFQCGQRHHEAAVGTEARVLQIGGDSGGQAQRKRDGRCRHGQP